jgi:hypothetical protein
MQRTKPRSQILPGEARAEPSRAPERQVAPTPHRVLRRSHASVGGDAPAQSTSPDGARFSDAINAGTADSGAGHDALIAEYRRANGLPPGGVDPNGQPVRPSDAEILRGGLLDRWIAAGRPGARPRPAPATPGSAYEPAALDGITLFGYQPTHGRAAPPGTEGVAHGQHFIVYADRILVGGHKAWRCHNPGAVRSRDGNHARATYRGALTIELHDPTPPHGFLIFEAPEQAVAAQEQVLASYARGHLTVGQALRDHYTDGDPRGESYVTWVMRHFGVARDAPFELRFVSATAAMIRGNEGPRHGATYTRGDADNPAWVNAMFGD